MNIAPEALQAFTQAADCGSFSAAARRLGKRQSSISESIAKLELDLGVELFIRGARQLSLTEAGAALLPHAYNLMLAQDRLQHHAAQLAQGQEPRLTLALSDAYQSQQYQTRLGELDERFPELKFECLIAEHTDMLELINSGRAHLGLISAQNRYPPDIAHTRISSQGEFGLYVAHNHALASLSSISQEDLSAYRGLYLSNVSPNALIEAQLIQPSSLSWHAADYLLLLEMAVLGFGWAMLPRQLVVRFGQGALQELPITGWPKRVPVDAIWSRKKALGPVAAWLLARLINDP